MGKALQTACGEAVLFKQSGKRGDTDAGAGPAEELPPRAR
jgi:hypothetical protein